MHKKQTKRVKAPFSHTQADAAPQEEDVWPVPTKLRAERLGQRAADLWREATNRGWFGSKVETRTESTSEA